MLSLAAPFLVPDLEFFSVAEKENEISIQKQDFLPPKNSKKKNCLIFPKSGERELTRPSYF
jgi:hypothetical protein